MSHKSGKRIPRFGRGGRAVHLGVLVLAVALPLGFAPAEDVTWEQAVKLTASDGAADDEFGLGVAISDDFAVVGARFDDDKGDKSGSAYVFARSGTAWSQQAKLTASDGAANAEFGHGVDVDGDTVVVGAPWAQNKGAAYVFTRSGTTWTQQAKLTASDAGGADWFGLEVAISDDTAVVGAFNQDKGTLLGVGAVYVFVRSGTIWTQQAKLNASDAAPSDHFGISVDIDGDTIVVGAPSDDDNGLNSGSAYVFARSGTTWAEQAKINPSDGATLDSFGRVAIDGDTVLIGAHGHDHSAYMDPGAAYVYTRSGTTWSLQSKLTASDRVSGDGFGFNVSLSGDLAIVGAVYADDEGNKSGKAYLFRRSGASWSQEQIVKAADSAAGYFFGERVAICGENAVVGARYAGSTTAGAAYLFRARTLVPPVADAGPDQTIHVGDDVELDGTGSYDDYTADGDLEFEWTLVSRPAGSTAALTGADTATPGFTADKTGAYEVELVVTDGDVFESEPDEVVLTATSGTTDPTLCLIAASEYIAGLPNSSFDAPGHRNSMTNAIAKILRFIDRDNLGQAEKHLEKLIARTDGCELRGAPDPKGKGKVEPADFITEYDDSIYVYDLLMCALDALDD